MAEAARGSGALPTGKCHHEHLPYPANQFVSRAIPIT